MNEQINDYEHDGNRPRALYEHTSEYGVITLVVSTYWGIVMVSTGPLLGTELFFTHAGRLYTRRMQLSHARRFCITLADRFAREVAM